MATLFHGSFRKINDGADQRTGAVKVIGRGERRQSQNKYQNQQNDTYCFHEVPHDYVSIGRTANRSRMPDQWTV
ncbi:hypothetical protein JCM31598_16030 [Desulfonatronum parangueonense]